MKSEVVTDFESSLTRLDVDRTKTTTDDVSDVLSDLIGQPAVGVPLSFDGVSLPSEVIVSPTPTELSAATTGITPASFAIASYGSIVIKATPEGAEPVSLFPDSHVAVVCESDILPGMSEAFERLVATIQTGQESAIIATGPSATADMGALVRGVHGPEDVHIVILTDQ
ncbi:LUD domain-containing protein [Haladaptatus sp. DFWS20]|uniref:LUD domain-containing protein n=1 Tax=Haladaptatus sp. DFWS20 TaxID=3403467 RepID=UPI003EB7B8A0